MSVNYRIHRSGKKGVFGNHFVERVRNTLLRGGQMTKYKGQTASYAPALGVSSPQTSPGAALGSILEQAAALLGATISARAFAIALTATAPMTFFGANAHAGVFVETALGSGIFVCSNAANAGDVTQNLTPPGGVALDVSTVPDFGIKTAAGSAINLSNIIGDTNISFTNNNLLPIIGNVSSIESNNLGTGALSITTQAVTGIDVVA